MGKALEIISGSASAPGATLTALTMASGDSLTVRNFEDGKARLLTLWPTGKTTLGAFQVRSPRLHDNVRGIQVENPVTPNYPPLWSQFLQELVAQDTLIAMISGSAGAGELMLASLLIMYDNLPGADAKLITPDQLKERGVDIMTCDNTLALTTGPNYTGAQAINTTNDLMKANTDYALIGYECSVSLGAVGWRGTDTANMRVGGPGRIAADFDTRDWFIKLCMLTGLPCIPVFNSANKSNTFVDGQQDEGAADSVITSHFVQLAD